MTDNSFIIHHQSEGGISAEHIPLLGAEVLVAPSVQDKTHNTIKSSLMPFACWKAGDMRFEFESSFVLPEIATELTGLKSLVDQHTLPNDKGEPTHKPALTVFGHADPTGNDDFNKLLSGRRAQAIYGLLTRKTDLWEELFNNPVDRWGKNALGTMLNTVSSGSPDDSTSQITEVENAGSKQDSVAEKREKEIARLQHDKAGRKILFAAYMDFICVSEVFRLDEADQIRMQDEGIAIADRLTALIGSEFPDEGDFLEAVVAAAGDLPTDEDALLKEVKKRKSFVVSPEDFLAGGEDAAGKGDYQGCGEFNPVFLQSQEDIDRLEKASASSSEKSILKAERDAANAPDRRVLIFLFRPGIRISPDAWPCPRVKEGTGGCRKRFFSDGDKRRNVRLPDKARKFVDTKDTFACRFYDRLSNSSPCEKQPRLTELTIRLIDDLDRPLKQTKYRLKIDKQRFKGVTGDDGILTHLIPESATLGKLTISQKLFHREDQKTGNRLINLWTIDLQIKDLPPIETIAGAKERLRNLGWFSGGPGDQTDMILFQRALQRFQTANDLNATGQLVNPNTKTADQKTINKLRDVYGS